MHESATEIKTYVPVVRVKEKEIERKNPRDDTPRVDIPMCIREDIIMIY